MYELVIVYEFGPNDTEEVVLYEGSEERVHRLAAELEREAWLAGMPYKGERERAPDPVGAEESPVEGDDQLTQMIADGIKYARAMEVCLASLKFLIPVVELVERLIDVDGDLKPEVEVVAASADQAAEALTRAAAFLIKLQSADGAVAGVITEIDKARARSVRLYPNANHFRTAYLQGVRAAIAGELASVCPYRRSGWAASGAAWRRGYDSFVADD